MDKCESIEKKGENVVQIITWFFYLSQLFVTSVN